MDSSSQPPDNRKEGHQAFLERLERQKLGILSKNADSPPVTSSWGEYLLPILFAGMETCWVDAIFIGLASFDLFHSYDPLMPLWAPFVLIAGSYWFARRLDRQADSTSPSSEEKNTASTSKSGVSGTSLYFILVGVMILFIIWLTIYAQAAFLLDPRWLLALLNDVLLLDLHFYQIFSIVALSLYFCWRGIRLSSREVEPSHVFNILRLGLGIFIVVILIRSGEASAGIPFHYDVALLLLIPIFLFLALSAHALARVAFVRRFHPTGLEGSVEKQERAIMTMIGVIGLVLLLLALLIGGVANPTFLADTQHALAPVVAALGRAYNLLIEGVAWLAVIVAAPFFWLFSLLVSLFPSRAASKTTPPNHNKPQTKPFVPPHASDTVPVLLPFIKIILPIFIVLALVFLVRLTLRKRRVRTLAAHHKNEETIESLWSWSLFWKQFKSFFRSLFARFFARRNTPEEETTTMLPIEGEPAARSIREIYRALLRRAASRGYPRKKDETPYEFQQRLDEQVPVAEPQLEVITEAYALTRYGGSVPDEAEVAHVRRVWSELEQKWV